MGWPLSFPQRNTDDQVVGRIQDALAETQTVVNACTINGGRVVTGVVLVAATAKTIDHGLGRTMSGWFVCRPNYDGTGTTSKVAEAATGSQPPNRALQFAIIADANCTIDVWVF